MKKVLLIALALICFGVSGHGKKYKEEIPKGRITPKLDKIAKLNPSLIPPPSVISRTLNVPLIKQLGNQLCWAACMEMIFKFHRDTSINQAMLATKKVGVQCECILSNPQSCSNNTCNVLINIAGPDFKNFFKEYSFHSQPIPTISWITLKTQIDSNRPFLAIVNENWCRTSGKPTGRHIVVVNGYYKRGATQYLIVQDPWLNSWALLKNIDYNITTNRSNFLSYINDIHKISDTSPTTDIATTLGISTNQEMLSALIEKIEAKSLYKQLAYSKIISEKLYDRISKDISFKSIIKDAKIYKMKNIYISDSSLSVYDKDLPLSYAKQGYSSDSLERCNMTRSLVTKNGIEFELHHVGDSYITSRISFAEFPSDLLNGGLSIRIKDRNDSIRVPLYFKGNNPNFRKVIYSTKQYEFYRFRYKNKFYLTPREKYDGLDFKKGVAYDENIIIEQLKKNN